MVNYGSCPVNCILILVRQLADLHGDRECSTEGLTGEGDLRVDCAALSVLQDGSDRVEEQRST